MCFRLSKSSLTRLLHFLIVLVGLFVSASSVQAQSCGHYVQTKFDKPHASQTEFLWANDDGMMADFLTPPTPGCRSKQPQPQTGVLAPIKLTKEQIFCYWIPSVFPQETKSDFPDFSKSLPEYLFGGRLFRPPRAVMLQA